ncbi:MAG TPA: hypothetical protein PLE82_04840, partial [Saccharofermentans sp.]|nr:hypothetical protein [Saccharofermentans sp.]
TFLRFNSKTVDTDFRIHSDGIILGKKPRYAIVVYIKGDERSSGTAFFKHNKYGESSIDSVFMEDDGNWQVTQIVPFEINKAVIYDSNKFHSRHPHQSESDRLVLVSFLE